MSILWFKTLLKPDMTVIYVEYFRSNTENSTDHISCFNLANNFKNKYLFFREPSEYQCVKRRYTLYWRRWSTQLLLSIKDKWPVTCFTC